MSAAATAAGYLYASGRLRSRASREEGAPQEEPAGRRDERGARRAEAPTRRAEPSVRRKEALVGRVPSESRVQAPRREPETRETDKSRPAPRVEYRTRRWRPES
jgi:hypothetical protein